MFESVAIEAVAAVTMPVSIREQNPSYAPGEHPQEQERDYAPHSLLGNWLTAQCDCHDRVRAKGQPNLAHRGLPSDKKPDDLRPPRRRTGASAADHQPDQNRSRQVRPFREIGRCESSRREQRRHLKYGVDEGPSSATLSVCRQDVEGDEMTSISGALKSALGGS